MPELLFFPATSPKDNMCGGDFCAGRTGKFSALLPESPSAE